MDLDQHDLPYFVEFLVSDEARRTPSGKRQVKPMQGFWMSRYGKARMRLSDRRLRHSVCLHALKEIGGLSVDKAAVQLAMQLGRRTVAEVDVIRVAYYECRSSIFQRQSFISQFLDWRAWVFRSDQQTLRFFLERGRGRLLMLVEALRSDPVQRDRNRSWLLEPSEPQRIRIESNYWDPEKDWQNLATDLWVLGRVHAEIGESTEAKDLLERAFSIWKMHGHKLAHQQSEAMAALDQEIPDYQRNESNLKP